MRVLIIDDHGVVRSGLRWLIEKQRGWTVAGEASSAAKGLALADELKPDVTVLDLSMPGGSGLRVIQQLARLTHVLVLTVHDDEDYARQSFSRGALGYLVKDGSEADYIAALSAVAAGQRYMPQGLSVLRGEAADSSVALKILSARERAVLRLVALGYTNKEIGSRFGISVKTVETYKTRIQGKLGLFSRAEMVRYALEQGLVDGGVD